MPEVESLAQSPSGQRQLRLMVALTELEPLDADHQTDIDPLYKDAERWGLEAETIDSDLEALKAKGWVRFWSDLGGIGTVVVDQPGIDAASGSSLSGTTRGAVPRRSETLCSTGSMTSTSAAFIRQASLIFSLAPTVSTLGNPIPRRAFPCL